MPASLPRPMGFDARLEREGVRVLGAEVPGAASILSAGALRFVAALERRFGARRRELLTLRRERQARFDAGELPAFLPETSEVRESDWAVSPAPSELADRRVEITGPTDRKGVIDALNSGAKAYVADFEDSHAPGWAATVLGQVNMRDAARRRIEFASPEGSLHTLREQTAVLMVRPRGWHMVERHLQVDGESASAALFDFGLYLFHAARALVERGTGPYVYLPKIENRLEARLWNDVFLWAQRELGLARGAVRATVLIETLPAAFEMHEILYELREHAAGLAFGRWGFIFSFIKAFSRRPEPLLPDRSALSVAQPFLRSCGRLLIDVCHRRGAHAMGAMAAQVPVKGDPAANERALASVHADKGREAEEGYDGTWVAHPALVGAALEAFERRFAGPSQLGRRAEGPEVAASDLLAPPLGAITEPGLRANLDLCLRYLSAWLSGNGRVPIGGLAEDAATAEVCRAQLWQWVRHGARLNDGRTATAALARDILGQELERLLGEGLHAPAPVRLAAEITRGLVEADEFVPFLTDAAGRYLD